MNHYKLVFLALDVRDVHVVSGGAKVFELLASEYVNCNEMNLRVTVLAGLGSAHFDDLAGAALNDDESVLAERRALHRIGSRSTGIGALEGMLMLMGKLVSKSWKENARAHAPVWRGKVCETAWMSLTWASSAMMKADKSEMKGANR